MTPLLIDAAVDLLLGYPGGLTKPEVAKRLGWAEWTAREVLRVGRLDGRIARVYFGRSRVAWTAAAHGPALAGQALEESRALAKARRQRKHEKARAAASRRKLYEQDDFDPTDVPDMPVQRVVTNTWAPVRVAPGPTSIFNLGTHHA